ERDWISVDLPVVGEEAIDVLPEPWEIGLRPSEQDTGARAVAGQVGAEAPPVRGREEDDASVDVQVVLTDDRRHEVAGLADDADHRRVEARARGTHGLAPACGAELGQGEGPDAVGVTDAETGPPGQVLVDRDLPGIVVAGQASLEDDGPAEA